MDIYQLESEMKVTLTEMDKYLKELGDLNGDPIRFRSASGIS